MVETRGRVAYEGGIEQAYQGLLESVRRVDNFTRPESQIKEQVVYKLLHKDTGLFYDPQKYQGNVSETGKVYSKKHARQSFIKVPNGVEVKTGFDVTTLPKNRHYGHYNTNLDDWEVVEYKLVKLNKGG